MRLIPSVGLDGAEADGVRQGVCPFALAFSRKATEQADAAGIVFASLCDQMRRLGDKTAGAAALPTLTLHVPRTWQTPESLEFYREELRRLGRFLVDVGGQTPSNKTLANIMLRHDAERKRARHAQPVPDGNQVPLAILGSPLPSDSLGIFDRVRAAGGYVALDATESGERGWPRRFNNGRLLENPFEELSEAYFHAIPDAARRPNHPLYEWLGREMIARQVRGLVVHHYVWCDLWHAETERLREWSSVPVLALTSGSEETPGRTRTAIEAFLEALR